MDQKWKIDDIDLQASFKLSKDFRCESLNLDVTQKDVCEICKQAQFDRTSCCRQSSFVKQMEIKATVTSKCNLKMDLRNALFNKELNDFTFVIDEEEIPVSRFILSVRSPVFQRMFSSEFKEKTVDRFNLDSNIPKNVFKEMIRYIYTDEIRELNKYVFDLLHASDYYQIECLKNICEGRLRTILKPSNANLIFQSAHLYQCSDALKEAAFFTIKQIFKANNYTLPENLFNNPSKVAKLFEMKKTFEDEIGQQTSTNELDKALSTNQIKAAIRDYFISVPLTK